jgi:hypothetical protein
MKLLGRNVDGTRLVQEVRERLSARGIREDAPDAPLEDEASVDPLAYLVQVLEDNADPAQPPPATSKARGVRHLVRSAARGLLEELFGRQRAFNIQVRDLAAQLSAEVVSLRRRVNELERLGTSASRPVQPRRPSKHPSGGQRSKPRPS